MSTLSKTYFSKIIEVIQAIAAEEEKAIDQAAGMIADAIQQGQRIFAFGCTHSALPVQDVIYRSGGLMLINPIYGPGITSLEVKPNTITTSMERLSGFAEILLDNNPIQKGDVLIIVSVSGRNAVPIEMAKLAKERGILVIGITSISYSSSVTSRHPSGKKMHEFADIVIDCKAEKGDAMLELEGVPTRITPSSGIGNIAILHALSTAIIEELVHRGITPPVFMAANVDGGAEFNAKMIAQYRDKIFYV